MKEIWKDIIGYENKYQISNLGRVKSLARLDSWGRPIKEKILDRGTDKKGYVAVILTKDGVQKTYKVHRLVATHFIPNPNNLPQVNHKDEDKTNNNINNLEWCTNKYNCNYGTRTKRLLETRESKILK